MTRPRPAAGGGRRLGVTPERLGKWLDGVAERHGAFTDVALDGDAVRVTSADTTTMTLRAPFGWTPGAALLTSFTSAAREPHRAAVLLVRRGRWAVGVFDGGDLVVSKVDSRQVQGRTALPSSATSVNAPCRSATPSSHLPSRSGATPSRRPPPAAGRGRVTPRRPARRAARRAGRRPPRRRSRR